jgi:hypothetical protein
LDRGIGNGLGCSDAGALPMHASLEKNPRLTPLRIGRSDASGNSGDGGLEVEGRPYRENSRSPGTRKNPETFTLIGGGDAELRAVPY